MRAQQSRKPLPPAPKQKVSRELSREAEGSPYWELLNLREPWELRSVDLDVASRCLQFHVRWPESVPLKCAVGRRVPSKTGMVNPEEDLQGKVSIVSSP